MFHINHCHFLNRNFIHHRCTYYETLEIVNAFNAGRDAPQYLRQGRSRKSYTHFSVSILAKVDVDYVTLPGWNTSITDITSYDALPENCRKYIEFIEASLGVPVEWIGVGPGRSSMLTKEVI